VRRLLETHHRTLHYGHVQEIPSGTLRLRLLPQAIEQGYFQGAKGQAVLPHLLRQDIRMNSQLPNPSYGYNTVFYTIYEPYPTRRTCPKTPVHLLTVHLCFV